MASRKKRRINESKYVLTALCCLVRYPLILGSLGTLVAGYLMNKNILYIIAIALFTLGLLSIAIYLMNCRAVICRLCRAEFLKKLRCVRKKDVPSIAGNVRIPLAFSILLRKATIQCPYCGEKHPYFGKR